MYKFKKLISSAAAFSVAASMFASVSFASIPSDTIGTDIETEATVLGALEIMVGDAGTGTFRPEDPIKRSEVTKVGVALMGLSDVAQSSKDTVVYPDVTKEHWASGYINVASGANLVIGDDTGEFRPDDQIKYSEAVAIIVRALGYEPKASASGGYPSGYMSTASSIGLTKGVPGSANELIDRGDVAKLAYNALTINLMEQIGFGDKVDYQITDKTLLSDKLDAELVVGKVEAIGSSALKSEDAVSRDEIKINGKVFKTGSADIRNILGFTVDAYVTAKSGSKAQKLLAAIPSDGENNVLTVGADSIYKVEDTIIHYYEDVDKSSKTVKATIDSDAFYMYNGKASSKDKLTAIPSGSIVLLDSDSDKKYDVVFINETQNYVVDAVYPSTHKITDKYGNGTLELDTEDESKTVILEKGSEKITVKDLAEWDVLTVTKSEDSNLIYATAVQKSISGKVSETDGQYVYIGGQKYKTASNYKDTISLGDEGTFYLDYEGRIAAVNAKSAKSSNYAYLMGASVSTGLDSGLKFKVFTKEGEIKIIDAADKIRVNSSSALSPQDALSRIGDAGKLITFETNSKGLVSRVNTFTDSETVDESIFTRNVSEENVVYRANSSKLITSEMNITVDNKTLIFDIPEGGEESDYSMRDKGIFTDGGLYNVEIFDVTEDYRAGVIIVTNSQAKPDESAPVAVVDSIASATGKDGEIVHKLYAFSEGKEITIMSETDKVFVKDGGKLLSQGDIIQYRTNSKGNADAIELLFDASKKDEEFKNTLSDDHVVLYGKISKKFSDSVNIQVNGEKAENYAVGDAKVYVYDTTISRNKLTVGDASDLDVYDNNGSRVFVRIYKDSVKEFVVIK